MTAGNPHSGFDARRATSADVSAVVQLHRVAFPHYESSRLGPRFCRRLFAEYLERDDAVVLVIDADGPALGGYLVGCPPWVQREVNTRLTRAAGVALLARAVRSPSEVLGRLAALARRARRVLVSALRRSRSVNPEGSGGNRTGADQRVVLVAVVAAARGTGAGDRLLAGFQAWAGERGSVSADLVVEAANRPARSLYERNGWLAAADGPSAANGDDGESMYYRLSIGS